MSFTDLHSHILPGFDDGARDEAQFLEMAQIALEGGTSRMVATPHYDLEGSTIELDEVAQSIERHAEFLNSRHMPLSLIPGVEVRISAALFTLAKDGEKLRRLRIGEASRFLLVDFPLFDLPVPTPDIIFQIQLSGLTPIIAHPERNRYLVKHGSMTKALVDRGVELQVNSGSLEGIYGKHARQSAMALIKEGVAKLVASDAHRPEGRGPDLSNAARIIERQLGADAARIMLQVNPDLVVGGETPIKVVNGDGRPSRVRFFSVRQSR